MIHNILSKYKSKTNAEEKIFPIRVYCRNCGTDFTKILSYDTKKEIIHYKCEKCGTEEELPISKVPHKLIWRVDWPFRWSYYNIHFEPGGKDHASPGGSYDTGKEISKKVFNREPPIFQGYEFVGLKGIAGKMSSSTGILITPNELLKIYEPEIIKYLFAKYDPMHAIDLDLGKDVLKVYAEFDREVKEHVSGSRRRYLELINGELHPLPVSFKQIAMLGQIFGWEPDKIKKVLNKLNISIDEQFLQKRLERAKYWIENYYPQFRMKLRERPNFEYARNLTNEEKEWLKKLKEKLDGGEFSLEKLEEMLYDIPKEPGLSNKEIKRRQRRFFRILYNLLIDSDEGPRAATLVYLLGKERVRELIEPVIRTDSFNEYK